MPSLQDSIDPASIVRVHALHQDIEIENDGSGNPIYVGWAIPGTGILESRWRICKLTYTATFVTAVNWASGTNEYKFVWNDRASYTYP